MIAVAVTSEVRDRRLSGDSLAVELERVERASVLVCHPDLVPTAVRACGDAGAQLKVRGSAERCRPGEWELF